MLIPRVGEQLGDFELIRRIGAGGMGVVYEARQISTGRRVALKILSPAMTREKNRRRFLREAEAAARLNHPNIVGVYAIGQDADLCYYAMELIEGWPLSRVRELMGVAGPSRLPIPELMRTHSDLQVEADPEADTVIEAGKRGPEAHVRNPPEPPLAKGGQEGNISAFEGGPDARPTTAPEPPLVKEGQETRDARPSVQSAIRNPKSPITSRSIIGDESYVRQVVVMLRDVARALHYAHSQGVTHRDIKPDNLLLDHQGKLHLVDFGLARVMEEDNITLTGELMGTPLYMSPEQVAAGRIGIDHRTDIYSLGVVMYQLLCLQPPYEAPTREALLRAIVVQPPRPLSSRNPAVPRELEAIVHHALEKDPDRRYASGGEMADDLDRWLAGKPISLRLPSRLGQRWAQLPRKTRRAIAGGACVTLALAAGLAAIALHGRHPPPPTQPAGPAEAIEYAARAADQGNYLRSALWYSEAIRRGAGAEQLSALQLSGVYDQLTPLNRRIALADGPHPWSLHPTLALCALADPLAHLRVWDLTGDPAAGKAFGPEQPVRWLSYDEAGACIWAIEPHEDGDLLQLWRPTGEAVASAPVKASGHIVGLRTASGPDGHTVAILTPAKDPRPGAGSADRLFDTAIYRIQPGRPPAQLRNLPGIRLLELSREGLYMAVLTGADVLVVGYLGSQSRSERPVGEAGSAVPFVFSPARQELALANTSGAVSLKDPSDVSSRPMELDLSPTGLRALTPPAYMRFSPDGKYLLVVGGDIQSTPPYLRSILVVDTRTTKQLYAKFGWDAFFSDDGRTLIWWDNDSVAFVSCEESQLVDRFEIPVRVLARGEVPQNPAAVSMSEAFRLPVQTDDQARRMLCIEAAEPAGGTNADLRVSEWHAQTGECLDVLLETPDVATFALDPTGRFALAQVEAARRELFSWDLGSPDEAYPRCARLPAPPASHDDIRVTRGPQVATMSRESGRVEWSLTDPATLRQADKTIPTPGLVSRWLISDDASVLLQIASDRVWAWNFHDGSLIVQNMPVPKASESVLGLSPTGQTMAVLAPDGGLELRDISTGPSAVRLGLADKRPVQVRFSPTGRHLAVAAAAPGHVIVCTPDPNPPLREFDTGAPVGQMEFCYDDSMLVVGHTGGRASLWSVSDGRRVATIEPAAQSSQGPGFSPATWPTRIAVRDEPAGDAPPLLATAFSNRIEVRPLPRPAQTGQPAFSAVQWARPLSLETTQGIVALAFPPPEYSTETKPAETQPSSADTSTPRPSERLLVITDRAAVRWFDLSVRKRAPEEWQKLIAEKTGMQLGPNGRPVPTPHH